MRFRVSLLHVRNGLRTFQGTTSSIQGFQLTITVQVVSAYLESTYVVESLVETYAKCMPHMVPASMGLFKVDV